jgi:hypothetical protein
MASPAVTLEIGEERRETTARVVASGTQEDVLARRLLVEKYGPGYDGDLTEWGRESLPIAMAWD